MTETENRLPLEAQYTIVSQRTSPELLASCSTRQARDLIDLRTINSLEVLPLGIFDFRGSKTMSVAVAEHADHSEIYSALRFASSMEIHLVKVQQECLKQALALCYSGDDKKLFEATNKVVELCIDQEQAEPDFNSMPEGEVPQFFNTLLEYALAHRCSDLHIIPKQSSCLIRLRKKAEMHSHQVKSYSSELHKRLLNRIKIVAEIETHTKKAILEGRLKFRFHKQDYLLRVSILPTIYGEKVVIRLPEKNKVKTLSELGLDCFSLKALGSALTRREGLILLTGPTGGGKTTTLYSCLENLHRQNLNIVTVEDPIELELEYASQTSLQDLDHTDYSQVVKALLRHDPDVIMLGEIRDRHSAQAAFEAAITGHLVLSTVHASGTVEALLRLFELGVSPLNLSQALNLILFQRLLPRLCSNCKVIDLTTTQQTKSQIYQGVGCHACSHTGYDGVQLIEEALSIDSLIQFALAENHSSVSPGDISQLLNKGNFLSFKESLKRRLLAGELDVASCVPYR